MKLAIAAMLALFAWSLCASAAPIAPIAGLERGAAVKVRSCYMTYQRSGLRRFFGQQYCVGK